LKKNKNNHFIMESSKKKPINQKKLIELLQNQTNEYLAGWQRCKADFENFKKQQQEWMKNYRLFANEDLLLEIIPVIDNLELALSHIPQNSESKSWGEGIVHIKKQLEEVLSHNNVRIIEVKPQDVFDPHIHECVAGSSEKDSFCEAKNSENQKNILIVKEAARNGYRLGEKILRPAQVTVISKHVTKES